MTTARNMVLILAAWAGAACGGAGQGSTAPLETARDGQKHASGRASHDAAGEHGEMAGLPLEVKTFHDALAPRWHAVKGPLRTADTCAAVPELRNDADAIARATPPERANPTDWAAGARQLGDAITALDAACKANDADQFEQAFAAVHQRFHGVMESVDGHGEHKE
jgi:hypothetical protein